MTIHWTETRTVGPIRARILSARNTTTVWGLTTTERLQRGLRQAGLSEFLDEETEWPPEGSVALLRGDVAYDGAILSGLLAQRNVLVAGEDTGTGRQPLAAHVDAHHAAVVSGWLRGECEPPRDVPVVLPQTIGEGYSADLRKREAPFCLPVTRENAREVEAHLFRGAYKGVTDLITKFVWPLPAAMVTRACARLGLTPNMVTTASAALVILAFWSFWEGHFGAGLLAAWTMTFLDTVDGKLARVTLTSTRFGRHFDHGIDLLHPPFWYAAWAVGLFGADARMSAPDWFAPVVTAIFAGYIAGRLCEGYFKYRFGLTIFIWRPFDSLFRLVTARRNPNLVPLTFFWLAGYPEVGLLAVAFWTLASTLILLIRIGQAELDRVRNAPVASWLEAAA